MGCVREAIIAAGLTALMILIFLGSWRSTVIVATSIPLSILSSLIILWFLGYTINIMTLGGLALAVGILVDDATVEIENIHRNLAMGKPITQAILDGAQQIAVPAFVSTLAICIVFVPVVFLTGAVQFLFTPLALAVVLAMLASYLLSRTLVPTMVQYLLHSEVERYAEDSDHGSGDIFWRIHGAFNRRFEMMREKYRSMLDWALRHRPLVLVEFGVLFASALIVASSQDRTFFRWWTRGSSVCTCARRRAPDSRRPIRFSKRWRRASSAPFRRRTSGLVLHNIGLPLGGVNLAFSDSSTIGPADGEILVSLKPEHRRSTFDYISELRRKLPQEFPDLTFLLSAGRHRQSDS